MKFAPILFAGLGVATSAQVAPGTAVRVQSNWSSGQSMIHLVEAATTGAVTDILGFSPYYHGMGGVALDPVTGEVYLGGHELGIVGYPANSEVHRIGMSGAAIVTQVFLGTLTAAGLPIEEVALDPNGDLLVCDRFFLYRVDRASGAATMLDQSSFYDVPIPIPSGERFAGLAVDATTNRLWVAMTENPWGTPFDVNSRIIEYDLGRGIAPGSGRQIVDLRALGLPEDVTDLAFDGASTLYLTTKNPVMSVVRFDLASGQAAVVPGAPNVVLEGMDYDDQRGLLHLVEWRALVSNEVYYLLDPLTGARTSFVESRGTGDVHNVAVNDFKDVTSVVPLFPSAVDPFTLETAAHGDPGDVAGVALISINGVPIGPVVLGVTTSDAGGFATMPSIDVAAGTFAPGSRMGFASARLSSFTGAIVVGSGVEIEVRP